MDYVSNKNNGHDTVPNHTRKIENKRLRHIKTVRYEFIKIVSQTLKD